VSEIFKKVTNECNKNQKNGIVLFEGSADCPKIIYTYIDSPESIQKANETYDMIFDQVLNSQSWKDKKKRNN
jgi:hypothetical protein